MVGLAAIDFPTNPLQDKILMKESRSCPQCYPNISLLVASCQIVSDRTNIEMAAAPCGQRLCQAIGS